MGLYAQKKQICKISPVGDFRYAASCLFLIKNDMRVHRQRDILGVLKEKSLCNFFILTSYEKQGWARG